MSGLSRYAAQALFDRTLNPSTRERPVYLALHSGPVNDETYGSEAHFTGYVRQPANSLYATVVAALDGEVMLVAKNGSAIEFPASSGPMETITHWALWDDPVTGAGNVLYSGAMASSRVVEDGDFVVVWPGELVLTFI